MVSYKSFIALVLFYVSHLPGGVEPMRVRTSAGTSVTPLQFNDAVCKRICVKAISDLLDSFHDFPKKFMDQLQAANESMAYDISQQLGERSRQVYQRKLLLQKIRKNTPCECVEEFARIEDYEDKVDEAYDFLLVRFDTLDKEEYYYDDTTPKITTHHMEDDMGYWHRRMFTPSTHDPYAYLRL